MCGIAGYIAKQHISKAIIHNTLDLMNNRGPDNKDFLYLPTSNASIGLLHSRLSIIDLDSRSNQPYTFGSYTIIFNGEIYNYKEFGDYKSDGYCILDLYKEHRVDFVKKLDGEFAILLLEK